MKRLITLSCLLAATQSFAQTGNVGIGTINPKAQLHTTGSVRFDTLRGTGVRPVYVNDSGNLVTGNETLATSNTSYAIPDADCAGASSPITITGLPTAVPSSNIQVRINISHNYDADLDIFLISPTGQSLNLTYQNGSSGDNFINTVFSDGATALLGSGSAPFTGSYKPVGSIAAVGTIYNISGGSSNCTYAGTITSFAGFGTTVVPNGTWTLIVIDRDGGVAGTLNSWSISFNGSSNFTPVIQAISGNYVPKGTYAGTFVNSSIYDNGHVGISTTAPMADLDMVGDTLGIRNGSAWDNLWFTVDGTTANINASGAENGLNFKVGANGVGAYGNGQTLTTAMTILPSGNVGIGAPIPAEKLDVVGNAKVSGNATVQGGKGIIRNNSGTQLKQVITSNLFTVSIAAYASAGVTVNFSEAFSAAPVVYVGNMTSVTSGTPEKLIVSIRNVTATSFDVWFTNATLSSGGGTASWNFIAIGPQ